MKRHGSSTSPTDTWPNGRAKHQPLSAPLGPELPGEIPRPPLSSHFLVAAQPSPPRVHGPFPCPIPPPPPPLSLQHPLQGPGLPGRPLPSDACRQRLWPPRTPAQLSAVTHPPLDRRLSPASPPMGSNPCLHTPAGCPSLTRSRPLLPTGTGPVGFAPGTSSTPRSLWPPETPDVTTVLQRVRLTRCFLYSQRASSGQCFQPLSRACWTLGEAVPTHPCPHPFSPQNTI